MPLKILQTGERVLREKAEPLSIEETRGGYIQQTIEVMKDTMYAAPGVGLEVDGPNASWVDPGLCPPLPDEGIPGVVTVARAVPVVALQVSVPGDAVPIVRLFPSTGTTLTGTEQRRTI
jgi:hypothetical protein